MTGDEIEEARKLCAAATPGPWVPRHEPRGSHGGGDEWHVDNTDGCVSCGLSDSNDKARNDAAFIAAARTLLPAALDEVERLRGLLEREAKRYEAMGFQSFADIVREDAAKGAP